MKFASYNIQFGMGLDGKYDLDRIAASLAGADVIALQEVTRGFEPNGYADLAGDLATFFPDYFWVYGAPCDVHLGTVVEDGRRRERRLQFGNMILSRWPILSTRTLLLPRQRTFDRLNLQRGATEAVLETPAGPLRVYSVHLDHTSVEERIMQIRYLKERAGRFTEEGGALTGASEFQLADPPLPEEYILLGDFNMQPESPEYVAMAGSTDPVYGRTLRSLNPVDALGWLGRLTAETYSCIDAKNHGRRLQLDYGFLSYGLLARLKDAFIDTNAQGSDHFPLWLELE